MMDWVTNNIATLLVGFILLGIVTGIIVKWIIDKKKGKHILSCIGGCEGCRLADVCHRGTTSRQDESNGPQHSETQQEQTERDTK